MRNTFVLSLAPCVLAAGCAPALVESEGRNTLVHLMTGPRGGQLPEKANAEAFAGRFVNMERLAH